MLVVEIAAFQVLASVVVIVLNIELATIDTIALLPLVCDEVRVPAKLAVDDAGAVPLLVDQVVPPEVELL